MRAVYKWLMKWTRTLHIYFSMFALLALFFFAATGFMLNHPAWFGFDKSRSGPTRKGQLPLTLVEEPLDKLQEQVVEQLRAHCGAEGTVDSFEIEKEALRVAFQGSDDRTTLLIDRKTGCVTTGEEGAAPKGELPPSLVANALDLYQLRIVESLRVDPTYGVFGLVDSFEIEKEVLRIGFQAPGRSARVVIKRDTGEVEADSETFGLTGQLTDLHKGKNAGSVWSLLIDSVSILLLFISLTGLILWLSLKKRILVGVAATSLGTAALLVLYFIFVP